MSSQKRLTSVEFFKATGNTGPTGSSGRGSLNVAPIGPTGSEASGTASDFEREKAYRLFLQPMLQALDKETAPISATKLYDAIRNQVEQTGLTSFNLALQQFQARKLAYVRGVDSTNNDPLYMITAEGHQLFTSLAPG